MGRFIQSRRYSSADRRGCLIEKGDRMKLSFVVVVAMVAGPVAFADDSDDRAKLTIESVTSIHPGLVPHARLDWAGFHS